VHGLYLAIVIGLRGRGVIVTQVQRVWRNPGFEIAQGLKLQMVVIGKRALHAVAHGQTQCFTRGVIAEAAQIRGSAVGDGGQTADGVIALRYHVGGGIGDGGKLPQQIVRVLGEILHLVDGLADRDDAAQIVASGSLQAPE